MSLTEKIQRIYSLWQNNDDSAPDSKKRLFNKLLQREASEVPICEGACTPQNALNRYGAYTRFPALSWESTKTQLTIFIGENDLIIIDKE